MSTPQSLIVHALAARDGLVRAATALATRGLTVIPLRRDKRPYGSWATIEGDGALAHTHRTLAAFPESVLGVRTGLRVDVLDLEAAGLAHFDLERLPATPVAVTQRGGRHIYFAAGRLENASLATGDLHLADVKAQNAYVVVPPSVGEHGAYFWLPGRSPLDLEPVEVPEWVVSWIESFRRGHVRGRRAQAQQGREPWQGAQPDVPPPNARSERAYPSRSERDAADAYRMAVEGYSREEAIEELRSRESASDHGRDPQRYAERTVDRAFGLRGEHDAAGECTAETVTATVVAVLSAGAGVAFSTDAGQQLRYPLDWPKTERSRARWYHLFRAGGLERDARPEDLRGCQVRLEVCRGAGGPVRVRRVFPLATEEAEP
jgi:hypothetical protein